MFTSRWPLCLILLLLTLQCVRATNFGDVPASSDVTTLWISPSQETTNLSGYVPTSRTLNINGTVFDLSANRIWSIPTGGVWGSITGTLSSQTDLQSALTAKVATSTTLSIAGTTLDLSTNRSWGLDTILGLSTTGIVSRTGVNALTTITDNSSNWNTAFTDRLKWDGGATGLTSSTGRTSLGLAAVSGTQQALVASDSTGAELTAAVKRAGGTSTSGTAGTSVASISAGASKQLVNIVGFVSQTSATSTQFTITITYSDTTTTTDTSVAATASSDVVNDQGIMRCAAGAWIASVNHSAKKITSVAVTTAGTGTGTRAAQLSALEVPQ